ncbi:rust resistance kinase Lr10-like [Ananas comosus]|uniref:Rust resistance kinase Lr10-like n=1 Tax=Ananas comosus TaxID=4615 RepID=A0A6P5FVR9_ANACO|nr:rust resistance kinase Lr10-like [Ananas comosus]
MVKLYPKDYSRISINAAKRTTEYIALELISRNFGIISYKSDVYCFGMLLMEMARGRRNVDCRQRIHARFFNLANQVEVLILLNNVEDHGVNLIFFLLRVDYFFQPRNGTTDVFRHKDDYDFIVQKGRRSVRNARMLWVRLWVRSLPLTMVAGVNDGHNGNNGSGGVGGLSGDGSSGLSGSVDDVGPLILFQTSPTVTLKVLRIPAKDYQGAQGLSLEEIVNDLVVRREITLSWSVPEITDVCKDCEAAGKTCYFSISKNTAFCRHRGEKIVKLTTGPSAAAFVILLAAVITLYIFRKSEKEKEMRIKVEKFLATYSDTKPTQYTFLQLKKMTWRFKVQLGQGGFGSVYKGVLPNGVPVAVKMLERSKGECEEFINEVATIGRIHHVNVVRLLGFCSDGSRRALIYEFLPNESLEKYTLRNSTSHQEPFRMDKLQEIAIGIARGIEYLHQGCDHRILHFDIKPHNILLDHNYNPKISDFSLAKLCSRDQSIVTMTAARGTMGYIAPEIYSRNFGTVSYKSDVYSFGMLMLELVGGKKIADPKIENQGEAYFPELVYEQLVSRQELELDIDMTASEEEIAKKLAIVALWCVQWNLVNRPTMSRTVQMLMGSLKDLEMPPKPFAPY